MAYPFDDYTEEDYKKSLADLIAEAQGAGYGNYTLMGDSLIGADGFVKPSTPEDVANYKQYQAAQLYVEPTADGGNKQITNKTLGINPATAPTAPAAPAKPVSQLEGYKSMLDQANAKLMQEEQFAQKNPNYYKPAELEQFAVRRDNLNKQMNQLAQLEQGEELRKDRGLLKNDPKYQNQLALAQLSKPAKRETKTVTVNGRVKLIDSATGEVISDLGPDAATLAADRKGAAEIKKAEEKAAEEAKKAKGLKDYTEGQMKSIEGALSDILGVKVEDLPTYLSGDLKKAQSIVAPQVGRIDQLVPAVLPDAVRIQSNIDRLQSLAQTFGLGNLKAAGVSPGSITVAEWPKFQAALANIDPNLSEKDFVKQLADVYARIQSTRTGVDTEAMNSGATTPAEPKGAAVPVKSIEEANRLPKGTLIILNGRRAVVE